MVDKKIMIPENSSSDCFDCIAYSMLKYLGLDYEAYNTVFFYTDYYCKSEQRVVRGKPKMDTLKDIYNIDVISEGRDGITDLPKTIAGLLTDTPVGIFISSYYCHWTPFFGKKHFMHCLLIIGADYVNKKYLCFDVHSKDAGYVEVDIETIQAYYQNHFIFDYAQTMQVDPGMLLDMINKGINNYDHDIARKTTEMLDCLIACNREVLFSDDLEISDSLINLLWISEDKRNFITALRYIGEKLMTDAFTPIYGLLLDSEKAFSVLKSLLVRYAITGMFEKARLERIIRQVHENDCLTVNSLYNRLKEIDYI